MAAAIRFVVLAPFLPSNSFDSRISSSSSGSPPSSASSPSSSPSSSLSSSSYKSTSSGNSILPCGSDLPDLDDPGVLVVSCLSCLFLDAGDSFTSSFGSHTFVMIWPVLGINVYMRNGGTLMASVGSILKQFCRLCKELAIYGQIIRTPATARTPLRWFMGSGDVYLCNYNYTTQYKPVLPL